MENKLILPQLVDINSATFKLIIPKSVEEKIRYICSIVHDIEWSGTLFYKAEGDLDKGTFKATCLDIFVMDIGTTGFTQFNDSEDIVSYRVEHADTLIGDGIYEALIHSHNNMSAFFSGTDRNTLQAEGNDLNHFLSLIVCNSGQYVAKITRKVFEHIESEVTAKLSIQSHYNTYENVPRSIKVEPITKVETSIKDEVVIENFNGIIEKEESNNPYEDITKRLFEIRKNKASKPTGIKNFQYSIPLYNEEEDVPLFPINPIVKENKPIIIKNKLPFKKEIIEEPDYLYLTEVAPDDVVEAFLSKLLSCNIFAKIETRNELFTRAKLLDEDFKEIFTTNIREDEREGFIDSFTNLLIEYFRMAPYEDSLCLKYMNGNSRMSEEITYIYAYSTLKYLEGFPESETLGMFKETLIDILPKE